MSVLGLSCGRKMQNTEVLVKSALMGAEELGVDVEFVRLLDLDIRPCRFCSTCLFLQEGPYSCVTKDDAAFLYDRIMENDGLILGAPVYSLTPPGYLKMFEDRMMGPKTDVAFITEYQKMGGKDRRGNPRFIDERAFKRRTGGFISLGGAITPHWLSFGLPLLYTMTFPLQIDIVDQMQVTRIGKFGHAVMQNEVMARARKLGRNVAKVMKNPTTEKKWFGDESGVCPVCHSNLLMIKNENPVVCPICGISGKLRVEGDNIIVTFSQKEQTRSRLTIAGKYEHWLELSGYGNLKQQVDTGEIARRLDEFQGYKEVKKCNKNV